jgi:hypothetical protein
MRKYDGHRPPIVMKSCSRNWMNWDSQHLTAAHGYADLGLWSDANAELEQISPSSGT